MFQACEPRSCSCRDSLTQVRTTARDQASLARFDLRQRAFKLNDQSIDARFSNKNVGATPENSYQESSVVRLSAEGAQLLQIFWFCKETRVAANF